MNRYLVGGELGLKNKCQAHPNSFSKPVLTRHFSGSVSGLVSTLTILILLGLVSCKKRETLSETNAPSGSGTLKSASIARGITVYRTSCAICHNSDPKKPGAIGPEVFGSSKELLEARILHKAYPAGYQPKSPTMIMQPLPQVKDDIDSLYLYLNETGK